MSFILGEREKERARVGRGAVGEGENLRLSTAKEPNAGVWSHDPETMTQSKTKNLTRNRLSHPSTSKINGYFGTRSKTKKFL